MSCRLDRVHPAKARNLKPAEGKTFRAVDQLLWLSEAFLGKPLPVVVESGVELDARWRRFSKCFKECIATAYLRYLDAVKGASVRQDKIIPRGMHRTSISAS